MWINCVEEIYTAYTLVRFVLCVELKIAWKKSLNDHLEPRQFRRETEKKNVLLTQFSIFCSVSVNMLCLFSVSPVIWLS